MSAGFWIWNLCAFFVCFKICGLKLPMNKSVAWLPGCSDCNRNADVELRTARKSVLPGDVEREYFPLSALPFPWSYPGNSLLKCFQGISELPQTWRTWRILGQYTFLAVLYLLCHCDLGEIRQRLLCWVDEEVQCTRDLSKTHWGLSLAEMG